MASKQTSGTTTRKRRKTQKKVEKTKKSGPTAQATRAVWSAMQTKTLEELDAYIDENEAHDSSARIGQNILAVLADAEPDMVSRTAKGLVARNKLARVAVNFLKGKALAKEAWATKKEAIAAFSYARDLLGRVL